MLPEDCAPGLTIRYNTTLSDVMPVSAISVYLHGESEAILSASTLLDPIAVDTILGSLRSCKLRDSTVIFCGVGKSGLVARKIAATFSSIGIASFFISPLDAGHGDIGVIRNNDIVFLLSNSGETEEIIQMLPHLKKRNTLIVSMTRSEKSTIAQASDIFLSTYVEREICPLNLAPTASTIVAMAIGDSLAAAYVEMFGFSKEDFAFNHPAGLLGKKLTLCASDLMVPIHLIQPLSTDSKLPEVISALTRDAPGCGNLGSSWIASSKGELVGLITDGDLRRALESHPSSDWPELQAINIATLDPLVIPPTMLAVEALKLMETNNRQPINILPVVTNDSSNTPVGMLRLHDLIRAGLKS